jgi:hypothetical protein
MGYPPPLIEGQFRRTDVHTLVELERVGVDDLATQRRGQLQTEVGLAGGGRSDDGDQGWWVCGHSSRA